jgi:hypothetical protein
MAERESQEERRKMGYVSDEKHPDMESKRMKSTFVKIFENSRSH